MLWRLRQWENWRYWEAQRTGQPQHPVLPERIQTDPNEVCPDKGEPGDLANFMRLLVLDWAEADPESRWHNMTEREVADANADRLGRKAHSHVRTDELVDKLAERQVELDNFVAVVPGKSSDFLGY